jgi:uncharacterized repeat protein (TIGR01451 family)
MGLGTANAVYQSRFTTFATGAITFTGNTLGLAKATGQNRPGTAHSIGTFITIDLGSRDGPAMVCSNDDTRSCAAAADCVSPATCVAGWPPGTTSDWRLSKSSAELRLPAGAQVLHAELIWSGTYAETVGQENVLAFVDAAVTFITPLGTMSVSPDPASSQITGSVGSTGKCSGACFYTRSADVTDAVQAGGAGTYAAGGVPATQSTKEDTSNAAGWTLAVVYQDPGLPVRNLTLFTAAERSGQPAVQVSGFCTPLTGTLSGRLLVSATEGDANQTGDEMLFGATSPLDTPSTTRAANRLSGPRNTATNFFSSQITDDSGNLDVAGSFGTVNHNPPNNVSGARQGWDIANVDVSTHLVPAQTSAFAQGTTSGESYYINALALQIDVGAPRFVNPSLSVDKPAAVVGDVLTYTLTLNNQGTAQANNVTVFDTPPPGTTFVPGSVRINGVAQPLADPTQAAGVPLAPTVPGGTITAGSTVTVTYQAIVNSIPSPPDEASFVNDARWTFDWVQCAGQAGQTLEITSNMVTTLTPRLEAAKEASPTTILPGEATTFRITVTNTGTAPATAATLTDVFPAGTTYVLGSTEFNLNPVADPLPPPPCCASISRPLGQIDPGESAVLSFQLTADATAAGTITNVVTIDPDGAGPLPPFTTDAPVTVMPVADVAINKVGNPGSILSGQTVTYTLTVTNNGPSAATDVMVIDNPPGNASSVSVTTSQGTCTQAPGQVTCSLGTVAASSPPITITVTATISGATGTIVGNTAAVTSSIDDPAPGNNTATADTGIQVPVVNLAVTKTDGTNEVTPGDPVTYTIVVTNTNPPGGATANGASVVDTFPPDAGSVNWTCAPAASCSPASGTGSIDAAVTIPPGGSVTFTAIAQIDPAATGQLVNTVTVTAPPDSVDPSSTQATDTDQLNPLADVQITKTKTAPPTITPGGRVTYQIEVLNDGPSVARDVTVDDPTPAGLTLVGAPTGCPMGFPCQLGTLQPHAAQTITATYEVAPDLAPGSVTNTASVFTSTPEDPAKLGNNTSTVESTVISRADLFVSKTSAAQVMPDTLSTPPGSVTPGTTAQYVITVGNRGPSVATGVMLSDPTPPGLIFLSASAPCAGGFPCALGSIAAGSDVTINLTYRVPSSLPEPGPVVNTVAVTSPPSQDPDPTNNTSTTSSDVFGVADITIEKTVTTPTALVGDTITYAVRVRNNGPSDASGIVVSDVIPAQETLQNATPSAGTYDAATGAWTVDSLAAGTEATLTTVVTVNSPGRISNVATKTGSDQLDPIRSNDSAAAIVNATSPADVGVDIVVDKANPAPNDFFTFTVTVTNRGPSPVTGATVMTGFVCDPGGTRVPVMLSTPSRGVYDGTTTWTLGDLAVGQMETLIGVIDLSKFEGCTSLRNQAVSSENEPDANPANDRDSVVVTPVGAELGPVPPAPPADLQLTKGASNTAPQFGERLTFTVTVRNNGPGTADGVVVLDPLPDGLTALPAPEISAQPSKGTFDAATGQWTVGALAVNESQTLALSMVVGRSGTIVNAAILSAPEDPNPDNNTATSTLQAGPEPATELSITKTASASTVRVGESITYTLTVSNAGPLPATGVVVTDVVPTQVSVGSATASQGSCSVAGGKVTCALGSMDIGATATVTIAATRIAPDAFGNTASVGSDLLDPDTANNTSTVETAAATTEICDNCIDDDGDGLVDAEDPDCCAAQPLTVTQARFRPGTSTVRLNATLPDTTFAGLDPRQTDVRLQIRNADGTVACCTIPSEKWQKLFRHTYGFFDQKMTVCPTVRCVKLALPKKGTERAAIIVGKATATTVQSPLDITISAGELCAQGQLSMRERAKGRAVFP